MGFFFWLVCSCRRVWDGIAKFDGVEGRPGLVQHLQDGGWDGVHLPPGTPGFVGGAGQEASLAAGFICANGRAGERVDGGADPSGLQAAAAGTAIPARLQDHPQGREGWQRPAHPRRGRQAG